MLGSFIHRMIANNVAHVPCRNPTVPLITLPRIWYYHIRSRTYEPEKHWRSHRHIQQYFSSRHLKLPLSPSNLTSIMSQWTCFQLFSHIIVHIYRSRGSVVTNAQRHAKYSYVRQICHLKHFNILFKYANIRILAEYKTASVKKHWW